MQLSIAMQQSKSFRHGKLVTVAESATVSKEGASLVATSADTSLVPASAVASFAPASIAVSSGAGGSATSSLAESGMRSAGGRSAGATSKAGASRVSGVGWFLSLSRSAAKAASGVGRSFAVTLSLVDAAASLASCWRWSSLHARPESAPKTISQELVVLMMLNYSTTREKVSLFLCQLVRSATVCEVQLTGKCAGRILDAWKIPPLPAPADGLPCCRSSLPPGVEVQANPCRVALGVMPGVAVPSAPEVPM